MRVLRPMHDPESELWVAKLSARDEETIERLHELLMRAARFEVRRRGTFADAEQLAADAAHDALMAVLAKLPTYRGQSRFTTWAYKFALLEASVKARRGAWRDREVPVDDVAFARLPGRENPAKSAETAELLEAVERGIRERLSPHQRHVLVQVALEDVPIDVLAERLDTTRGALYKTLHDARKKLREYLAGEGLDVQMTKEAA
jgi:RNA polymerase sigma-70 factor, ECF subfamily